MNGAELALRTLAEHGVDTCFANPGTSEMQMVAAFDHEPRIRPVLCLFEGVATGAADGYARIAGKPAATLLHLGPGLSNGSANLHNARRAASPVVNIVGDHATYHRGYDAPLTSDIAGLAAPVSVFVASPETPADLAVAAAEVWVGSQAPTAGPATLILPANCAWTDVEDAVPRRQVPKPLPVSGDQVERVAEATRRASRPALLLGSGACTEAGLAAAGSIAAAGIKVFVDTFVSRLPRGRGRFAPRRLPYFAEAALAALDGVDLLVLVGTRVPVAFFSYPDRPSVLLPEGTAAETLASPVENAEAALRDLADLIGNAGVLTLPLPPVDPPAAGPTLTAPMIGAAIARHLPEDSIISDDGTTAGAPVFQQTSHAAAHDWLYLTGGAIGQGIPVAIGAAIARPGAKLVSLNGDGAAAYCVQGLWTAAREKLDLTVIIVANGAYRILATELVRTGAGEGGPSARSLIDLGTPAIDWCALAQGFGVPSERADTAEDFDRAFAGAMNRSGPSLIMAVTP